METQTSKLSQLFELVQEDRAKERRAILDLGDTAADAAKVYASTRWVYLAKQQRYLDTYSQELDLFTLKQVQYRLDDTNVFVGSTETSSSVLKALNDSDGFISMWDTVYQPSQPAMVIKNTDRYFNTYNPPAIKPIQPTTEEQTIIDEYLDFVAPDADDRTALECWLSQAAVCPENRNKFALIMYGRSQGTGKGTLQEMLTRQMGRHNTFKPDNSAGWADNNHKDGVMNKTLLIMDELYHDGMKVANTMKPFITEPQLEVNPKGKAALTLDNHLNILAASNSTQPLWIEKGDRRWFCLNVEWHNPLEKGTHADNEVQHQKVVRFAKWLNEDARADGVMRWWLENINRQDWDVTKAPENTHKHKLIDNSESIGEDYLKQWADSSNDLIVRRSELFKTLQIPHMAGKAKQERWLTDKGFLPVVGKTQVNGLRASDWWITQEGVRNGLTPTMNGTELTNAINELQPDKQLAIQ